MRISRVIAATIFSAGLLGAAAASAGPIGLPAGPIFGKFTGVEQVAPGNNTMGVGAPYPAVGASGNEGTFGAFVVDNLSIGQVTIPNQKIGNLGPQFFANGGGGAVYGPQITGLFYGTTITQFSSTGAQGNGGVVDLYWWDKNNASQSALDAANPATARVSQSQFSGITCGAPLPGGSLAAGCTPLARLLLIPGAVDNGTTVNAGVTAAAVGDLANGNGTSDFYLQVDPSFTQGAWTKALDGNFFEFNFNGLVLPVVGDLESKYNFLHCTTGCSAWNGTNIFGEDLQDPFTAFAIPEPASLALFGTGLLAMGMAWRKKSKSERR